MYHIGHVMDHYQERIHDPLLFLNSEKSQDTFELQNTFADGMGVSELCKDLIDTHHLKINKISNLYLT